MREIRTLRATWRGLETWHGRDASTWTGAPVLDPTYEGPRVKLPRPTHPYIPTWSGFLYLAVVLDAYSRRIVGWSMATTFATQLVLDALDMALLTRRPKGVIHHSDQGSQAGLKWSSQQDLLRRSLESAQYTSIAFGQRCRDAGVRPSMGSVGDAGACPRAGVAGPGGQRDVRELLRHAGVRAARTLPVQGAG